MRIALVVLAASLLAACPAPVKRERRAARGPLVPPPIGSLAEAALPAAGSSLGVEAGLGYPRFPHLHGEVVVFTAEGDLWQVGVRGGLARRLTTHPGLELFARFSPDGRWLAFSGDYDGNTDAFVMPSVGGVPRRLTFHPAEDHVLGWTPDGKSVLFRSRRDHPHGDWTLYTIALEGGDPLRLPLGRAARLAWEPGGARVAINITDNDFRRWKRYAGGTATQILVGDLEGTPFRRVTTFLGANSYPMWHGGRIYFLSDRDGTLNIWSMTPEGRDLRQHTRHQDFDVRFPSLGWEGGERGGGRIVFQHGAELRVLELASGREQPIPVRIASDAVATRSRFTAPAKYLSDFELSPDGKRLALEIRGNLHTVPAGKEGRRVQLSRATWARKRGLSFSDDGRELATTSDASGESEIWIFDARGEREPRQLTRGSQRFKYPPRWAPGGKHLAWSDSDNRLYLMPARGGPAREIDRSSYDRIRHYAFSPDGRWLAYAKVEENYLGSIFLYDVEHGRAVRVTDATTNDWAPTFSSDGKYLAFLSDRTINPLLDKLDQETIVDKATKPYLVLLAKATRSPFLPREPGADEAEKEKEKEKEKDKGKAAAKGKPKLAPTAVDVEGIAERVVEVPVGAGHYQGLYAGKGFLVWLSSPTVGMGDWEQLYFAGGEPTATLQRFDLAKKKDEKLADEVVSYDISRDESKIVLRRKQAKLYSFKLEPKLSLGPEALKEAELAVGELREEVDVRAEWRQMFHETWRMMRDFYFAADMCKVDWPAMGKKYAALLPRVASRDELEDLLGEMVAELSLGHTYVWGGDQRPVERVPVGLLGADFEPHESGRYRIARIYSGAGWDPKRASPLTLAHAQVREGEFLQKIDGRPLRAGDNVYSRLQKAAGELVQLTVSSDAAGLKARAVEVTTLRSETPVRYYDWVKRNREEVARRTAGRVGYLHLPDMMTAGMVEFDRWFYPQVFKQGLVVDARWNRGGFVSQMIVKRLVRRVLSWAKARTGYVAPYPENTLNGRLVVLTNERAGSDGDIFPRAIQVAQVGPVIGTRTWGGVVGINLQLPLVDKGVSTRPGYFAWWEPERRWGVEGEGVHPDIVVENDPGAEFRGIDAQLARGIETALALLAKSPPQPPAFGEHPDKRKETWVKRYGKTNVP